MKRELITSFIFALLAAVVLCGSVFYLNPKITQNKQDYFLTILQKAVDSDDFNINDFIVYTYNSTNKTIDLSNFNTPKNTTDFIFYVYKPSGKIIFDINGKGLWADIYGLLVLNSNLTGHIFYVYKHGETPGLGGQIESKQWQEKWKDVVLLDQNTNPGDFPIDAISGATKTSQAIERLIKGNLQKLKPVLEKFYEGNLSQSIY